MCRTLGVSERRACGALDQPRSPQWYQPIEDDEERHLVWRMLQLVREHPRFGSRRITALLRCENWNVNLKRVHRLWKQQGHKVPKKLRKRRAIGGVKRTRHRATHQDHVWAWGVSLPISDAFTPSDLAATSCHLFDIDSHAVFQDTRGRPYRVFQGDPIRALL